MNDVLLWTSSIPQDLSLWRVQFETLRKELPPRTKGTAPAWAEAIRKSVELHKSTRKVTLSAQHRKFATEILSKKTDEDLARSTYIVMALKLPLPSSYLLNQQLMFVEENRIWATTLLAKEMLTAYWEKSTVEALEATVKDVFSSTEYGNDIKGRILEIYILKKLQSSSVTENGFQLKC
jgi:putative ribosome biogenesis GTPase RsgA